MPIKIISRVASPLILLIVIATCSSCTQETSTYLPEAFNFKGGGGYVYPWTSWVTDGPVFAITRSGNNVYFGGQFTNVYANTGGGAVLDATSGMVVPDGKVPYIDGAVNAVAPDGKGGWYIGGWFFRVGNKPKNNLAHIRPDGSVDDWNPIANGDVMAIAVSGNLVYVGGYFNDGGVAGTITIGGRSRNYIAVLDAGTGVATDWNPDADGGVTVITLSGNIIYAGGDFTAIGGAVRNYIAALNNTDGSAVATWDPNANSSVYSIVVSGDSVFAAGAFNDSLGTPTIGGQTRNYIAELDAVGSPGATGAATAWDPNANGQVIAMTMSGAGLITYGTFTAFTDNTAWPLTMYTRQYIAILDPITGIPASWTITPNDWVTSASIIGDILFIGGLFTTINSGGVDYTRNFAASFDLSTGDITGWNPDPNGSVYTVKSVPRKVYVGGSFAGINYHARNGLAAVDLSTGLLSDWDPGMIGNTVNAMKADDDTVYVGGDFTGFDYLGVTVPRDNIAAIDGTTGWPIVWEPHCDGPVSSLAINGSVVYAGGSFTQVTNPDATVVARSNIAAIDKDTGYTVHPTTPGQGWDIGAGGPVYTMLADGDILYVGGSFGYIGSALSRNYLAALDAASGETISAWDPNPDAPVLALAISGGSLYLGGEFGNLLNSGTARQYLAAVDAATGVPSPWDPQPDMFVSTLKVSGGRLYVGGDFTTMAINPPLMPALDRVAIFDLTSATLNSIRTHLDNTVMAIEVYGATMYLGGGFTGVNGSSMPYLAAISLRSGQPVGYDW
ncbi:MAG: hypothetical protein JW807_05065 [Spirochaetes bacterium]|nr:hypothetical protein [Spirochaetota bacterium]